MLINNSFNDGNLSEIDEFHKPRSFGVGLIYATIGVAGMSIMVIASKLQFRASDVITTFDLVFARSVVGLPVYIFQAYYFKVKVFDYKNSFFPLLGSVLGNWIVIVLEIFSYKFVSATKGLLIIDANPILTAMLAYFLLGDYISRHDVLSLFVMFSGGYLITLSDSENEYDNSNKTIGYICLFITLAVYSCCLICVKIVSGKLHFIMYPLYASVWILLSTFVIWSYTDGLVNFSKYTMQDIGFMAMFGFGSLFGQLFMSIAFMYLDATFFSLYLNGQIVMVFFVEFLFLGYTYTISDYLGGSFITIAICISIISRK